MGNCDKCKLKADNVNLNIDTTKDKKGLDTIEMKLSYLSGVEEVNLDIDHGQAIILYDDRIIDLITIEETLNQIQTMKVF
ncbi:MAG: hypothetical protein FH762_17930 [Firmicutes bacterium]|nr:hypothetical protein [Bacillota bacterium]